jgi:arginyl-tRNA synthetase
LKHHLENLVAEAINRLRAATTLPADTAPVIEIERTRTKEHGDFATNIALKLSKAAQLKPRALAQQIVAALPSSDYVARVEIAGAGFINFHLRPDAYHDTVRTILAGGSNYGRSKVGENRRIQVEYVSANPTGPLHVGHGRGAAYGATVANLLDAVGFRVHREYYVNDAGRQMDILATSVWLRYLEQCGETLAFPTNGYKGRYVHEIAEAIHSAHGDMYRRPAGEVFRGVPPDAPQGGERETHIDALVERAKQLLGPTQYQQVFDTGLAAILNDIRDDLKEFGVAYDEWYSERSLAEGGLVDRAIERLKQSGHAYEREGALWFRSTDYGDEKNRVLVRENGLKTYFASDIAYHMDKFDRGFERVIDVWGADHHGYVPRVKAALSALGDDPTKLDVLLVQFAILYRGGERVRMSTRSGEFVTLRELRQEVGNDAARFFYVLRKCEQHMDFDLDLAKSESADNPVYYVQYAHARVCSVFKQLTGKGLMHNSENGVRQLQLLTEDHERALIGRLARYPEVIEAAALAHEPHQLAHFLRELAYDFHTYYNTHTFLVDETNLRDARLCLIGATRQVLANGLELLGVSAPESM